MDKLHEIQALDQALGFYRLREVLEVLPISASSFWAGVAKGFYPKPRKIGPKCTAWLKRDVHLLCMMLNEIDEYFQFVASHGGCFEAAANYFLNQHKKMVVAADMVVISKVITR